MYAVLHDIKVIKSGNYLPYWHCACYASAARLFLHSFMASLLPQWRAVLFLLLPAGWQIFCLAELANAVALWL